jgi:hypothetical protein
VGVKGGNMKKLVIVFLIIGLFTVQASADTTLTYDPLPEGEKWNLANKIHRITGYWCNIVTTGTATYLHFYDVTLTEEQIAEINILMADITAQDPDMGSPGNTYIIKDIWVWRTELEAQTGVKFFITYGSSGIFGDEDDLIYLKPVEDDYVTERVLSPNERNAVDNVIKQNFGGWQ